MSEMNIKKKQANKNINSIVGANLKRLLEKNNISQDSLSEQLKEIGNGYTLDRTTINKIINAPDDQNLSLPFLNACAEYFCTTVDFLISKHEDTEYEVLYNNFFSSGKYPKQKNSYLGGKKQSEFFIEDPDSVFFRNYMNTYYCYYYSTASDENKKDNPILTGNLELFSENGTCKCILEVNTRKLNIQGEEIKKIYTGSTSICLATHTVHCAMREEKIGEYCDLMFRYSQINNARQACRMAEVLSTSALPDKRYPIVHRMLLSIEPIDMEHFDLIKPQLCFNCSEIAIDENDLDYISEQSEEYKILIQKLKKSSCKKMYLLDEKKVKNVVQELGLGESDQFTNKLRSYSYAHRYNKVSTRVDLNIWNILHNAGYYNY